MQKALVPIANGTEEMEAVIVIDILRRAGWTVTVVGLTGRDILASRGVRIVADNCWDDIDPGSHDVLVLPGGGDGTDAFCSHAGLLQAVAQFAAAGKTVAAICAAPLALQKAGVLAGRRATCHPAVVGEMGLTELCTDAVVTDGNIITSRGAGTAFEFALEILKQNGSELAAKDIAAAIVLR